MHASEARLTDRKQFFGEMSGELDSTRGFFSSVRAASAGLLLNGNVTCTAFYSKTNLATTLWQFKQQKDDKTNDRHLQAFLKGLRIGVDYLPEKLNKARKPIPDTRTISGSASQGEGGKKQYPLCIPVGMPLGVGPKSVKFWRRESVDGEDIDLNDQSGNGTYVSG